MTIVYNILIALGLQILLLSLRLLSRRRRMPPIPVRLPSLSIWLWLIISSVPDSLVALRFRPWLESALLLSQCYAALQLLVWCTLEAPSSLPWWPRPPKILRDLGTLMVGMAITVMVLQEQAKINVVGLVTTSAILTAVIGLAAQESLKDLFAGIVLQIDSSFQEGDFISAGDGIEGWVVSLTLMSTRLQHAHGALITLPNSKMWSAEIRRFGPRGPIAREIYLNLDLDLPPEKATTMLLQVARRNPLVLSEPEPTAFVYAYGDHAITYELEVWHEDPTDNGFDILRGQLLAQIWYALERSGRTLPYPIREFRPKRMPAMVDDPAGFDLPLRLDLLRQNPLFGHLSSIQLEQIAPLTRCLRYAMGESIIVEGEYGDALYQLVSGKVEVIKRMEDEGPKKIAQLGVGAIIGEMSVFSDQPRSASVRAMEECVLLEVEREDLRPVLEGNPRLVEELAHLVGERRAQLISLSQEVKEAQVNQLIHHMLQIFSSLTGGEADDHP